MKRTKKTNVCIRRVVAIIDKVDDYVLVSAGLDDDENEKL
jgi:hypothetical protein